MKSFTDLAATILGGRHIDPATPPVEQPPWDPIAWRVEQATAVLDDATPGRYRDAQVRGETLIRWAAGFRADARSYPSLLLLGEPGRGKTHTGWALLRSVVLAEAARGVTVQWRAISHPALNDALRPKADGSHDGALDVYMNAGLLFLDDFAAGRQTDWSGDNAYRLVDHRWTNGLPTIYATNLDDKAVAAAVGDRTQSRVWSSTRVMFGGPDRRAAQ